MRRWLVILGLTLLTSLAGVCQTTSINLNESTTYPSAGAGINLGTATSYDSYITQNLLMAGTPSGQAYVNNISVNQATAGTTFTDTNPYSGVTANQYAGGTLYVECNPGQLSGSVQVCTGGNYHNTYTIASNTAANGTTGAVFTLSGGAVTHPQYETAIVIGPIITSLVTDTIFGWVEGSSGTGSAAIDTAGGDQVSDAVQSTTQVFELLIGSGTGTSNWSFGWNNASDNYAFSGTYTCGADIKILSGSGMTVTCNVTATGVSSNFVFTPTGTGYSTYSATNTITTATPGTIRVTYTLSGCTSCSVTLTNMKLLEPKTNASATFRDQVATNLTTTANVGECRFSFSSNGDTLLNALSTQKTRKGLAPLGNAYEYGPSLGLHDSMAACAALGRKQFEFAFPITWTTTDMTNLVDYLGGTTGTYAGYRVSLGQTTPWTSVYTRIVLEHGNEVWNPGSGNVYIPSYVIGGNAYWNYLPMAVLLATAAKADGNWNSSVEKFAVGIQTVNSSFQRGLVALFDPTNTIDIVTENGYGSADLTSCSTTNLFQSSTTEAWSWANDTSTNPYLGCVGGTGTQQCEVYEYQYSGAIGSCTQAQLTGNPEGLGAGLTDTLWPAWANKTLGMLDVDFFVLFQNSFNITTSAGTFPYAIWGGWTGPGGSFNNARPSMYALGMYNTCANLGTGYSASPVSPPTLNFSAINGVNAYSAVPLIQSFAFKSGTNRCIAVYNTDYSASHAITFTGTNAPTSATLTLLSSTNTTDSNESSLVVQPATSTVTFPHTLPAHSFAIYQFSTAITSTTGTQIQGAKITGATIQ
jgi:hypothetical protein